MAQLPPIVENLSGLDIKKLVELLPQLKSDRAIKQESGH
jgi:hypothetical protein